jgi:hypothetical protein
MRSLIGFLMFGLIAAGAQSKEQKAEAPATELAVSAPDASSSDPETHDSEAFASVESILSEPKLPPMPPDLFFKRVLAVLKSGEPKDYYLSVGDHAGWASLLDSEAASKKAFEQMRECAVDDQQCLQSKLQMAEHQKAQAAEVAEFKAKLKAPKAVDQLWQSYRTDLEKLAQELEAGKLMAIGAAQLAIANEKTLLPAERAALLELHQRISSVLMQTRFDDERLIKQVIGDALPLLHQVVLMREADGSGPDLESKFWPVWHQVTIKISKRIGLDLEAVLSTLQVQTLEHQGERAKVAISFRMLDVPVRLESKLRWDSHSAFGIWVPDDRPEQKPE